MTAMVNSAQQESALNPVPLASETLNEVGKHPVKKVGTFHLMFGLVLTDSQLQRLSFLAYRLSRALMSTIRLKAFEALTISSLRPWS